ncbi:hypothetical protein DFP72DRAFT_1067345 [Ephemerocybe angulata]|uniref:Uncharacterized protein n=1 Tax=Ephemerocybe angulata TaxID=980116 RepID=A0A8H6HZY4_9AGAR|nr:hypothetical protein DFP72DRAFT_1067345 [Tulosesus angulatus]
MPAAAAAARLREATTTVTTTTTTTTILTPTARLSSSNARATRTGSSAGSLRRRTSFRPWSNWVSTPRISSIEHWVDELEGRQQALLEAARGRGRARGPKDEDADRPPTPEGLEGEDLERFRAERDRARGRRARTQAEAVELMARRRLAERVGRMFGVGKDDGGDDRDVGNLELDKFMDSLLQEQERRRERSSSTLSPALLAGAPHLADLAKQAVSDPHIERTIRLRRLFAGKKNSDNLVDVSQAWCSSFWMGQA